MLAAEVLFISVGSDQDSASALTQTERTMQLKKNNFVVTLKTAKEVTDYMDLHIPEEQRLLWMGFFIAHKGCYCSKLEELKLSSRKKQLSMSNGPGHGSPDQQFRTKTHLLKIFAVCKLTPETQHWMPTREAKKFLPQ